MKHYFPFGHFTADLKDAQLYSAESWDSLRDGHPNFVIPDDRDAWLAGLGQGKDGDGASTKNCAADIAHLLWKSGVNNIHSVGVGGAPLEYNLKQLAPSVHLTASDYSRGSIFRLRNVFVECDEIVMFDVLNDDWRAINKTPRDSATVMYRVDPCFTNRQWTHIFRRMHDANVQHIVFVPDQVLSVISITRAQKKRWRARLSGVASSFAGYNRSKGAFIRFWKDLYDYEEVFLGGKASYFLKRK